MITKKSEFLVPLTPELEERIKRISALNIDPYIIPSPYIRHRNLVKDYRHSYAWNAQGEILGYLQVYSDPEREVYHLYRQVTSPFGRGRGIGTAFLEALAADLPDTAVVYLYVWEKQVDSIDFFRSRGFATLEQLVYRHQSFCLMEATARDIREHLHSEAAKMLTEQEAIGKVRHDARKYLQLLLDMVNMLSVDNCSQIIESINRESNSLVNLLNDYGDRIKPEHRISLRDLIIERVIPYIEASAVPCEINLRLQNRIPTILAHYVDVGRALINLAANALDAIQAVDRKGIIDINLKEEGDKVILRMRDNGQGMKPERLELDEEGIPVFVGRTTKGIEAGEGFGTKQIFSTFGAKNIQVTSEYGVFTEWRISLTRSTVEKTTTLSELEDRFLRLIESTGPDIDAHASPAQIRGFIRHARELELLSYDLVSQFSMYSNIRDIYRSILAYLYGGKGDAYMEAELNAYRTDTPALRSHLLAVLRRVRHNNELLARYASSPEYAHDLFASYGRDDRYTIIFTMDPETGRFYCTERKLAEHFDLVPYMGKDRDELLRGEINGNALNPEDPLILGVWSTKDRADLIERLTLIREGARRLLEMGVNPKKRLGFYNTTYNTHDEKIDSYKKTTIHDMAGVSDNELPAFIISNDDELSGYIFDD